MILVFSPAITAPGPSARGAAPGVDHAPAASCRQPGGVLPDRGSLIHDREGFATAIRTEPFMIMEAGWLLTRIRAVGVPRHARAPRVARVPHRGGSGATGRPGFRVDVTLYQLLQGRCAIDLVSMLVGAGATGTGVTWEVGAAGDVAGS
jgi:hypothetical protein